MKLVFLKNYLTFKKDETHEIEDKEVAGDLIAKGFASEVKAEKSAEAGIADEIKAIVEQAAKDGYAKGLEEGKKDAVKALKGSRQTIVVGDDRRLLNPTGGFNTFSEFCKSVIKKDYTQKAGIAETTDGAAVPVEYLTQIFSIINSETSLLSRCQQYPTNTSSVKLPIDNLINIGTNAVTGAWTSEGSAGLPKGTGVLNQLSFSLNKYLTLVSITDEMLTDNNVLLEAFTTRKAGYDIQYQLNKVIINGTGVGQPQGIVGSAATLTINSQYATEYTSYGTYFDYHDITDMLAQFLPLQGEESDPVWLINPTNKQYVYQLKDDNNRNLYFAPGTVQQDPTHAEYLAGYPIIWAWQCPRAGQPGDIILADMAAYGALVKTEGVQAASSMHLYFDQDRMAFRYTIRLDGKPLLAQPLVSPDGSGTKFSPFVVLNQRT